eukprot:XP_011660843.1 PREDICTED: atlastin-1-like [Strongylocentrotus purpuratus]
MSEAYITIYKGDVLPEPKTILQATAEANNLAAVASALDKYTKDMEQVCGGDKPYLSPDELKKKHNQVEEAAINQFRKVRKMGGRQYSHQYEEKLLAQIKTYEQQYIKHNENKKPFNMKTILPTYNTPLVIGIVGGLIIVCFCTITPISVIRPVKTVKKIADILKGITKCW